MTNPDKNHQDDPSDPDKIHTAIQNNKKWRQLVQGDGNSIPVASLNWSDVIKLACFEPVQKLLEAIAEDGFSETARYKFSRSGAMSDYPVFGMLLQSPLCTGKDHGETSHHHWLILLFELSPLSRNIKNLKVFPFVNPYTKQLFQTLTECQEFIEKHGIPMLPFEAPAFIYGITGSPSLN